MTTDGGWGDRGMNIVVRDSHTEIFLTHEEVFELCKPGEGENTCIWLMVGADGFECAYFKRPTALVKRWVKGETVAKRNGCEKVKSMKYKVKYAEATTLEDIIGKG